jgi:hypothetical protein
VFCGSAFAAAPFAATGADTYNASISESGVAQDTVAAVATFIASFLAGASGSDAFDAGGSTFNASFVDAADASDSVDAPGSTFSATVVDAAEGADEMLVAPSTFGATVVEMAEAADAFVALVAFVCTLSESADIADQITARLLWEIIDDSQTANWGTINDSQTTTWSNIDDSAPNTWGIIPNTNGT